MEDDDAENGRLVVDLYCDEDPLVSTPPLPTISFSSAPVVVVDDEQLLGLMMEYKAKERLYAPPSSTNYLHHLIVDMKHHHHAAAGVSSARSTAVHYIIYVFGRLGLAATSAFNAVNYLDRFLSINCHLSWEVWMVEVVSVACLSVACKLDEVDIPSLHDLQMEEAMSHSFRASTIRDMELTLLKALQWRLACVTPFTFLDLLLLHLPCTLTSRCTALLLRSLSDPSFLRFDASVVAASALRCLPLQDHLTHLIRPLCQLGNNEADECFKMMKTLDTSVGLDLSNYNHHKYSHQQWSPISVIPFQTQTDGTVNSNRSAVSRRLFGRPTTTAPDADPTQDEDRTTYTR